MAGYAYVAVDIQGKEKKGKMEAPDKDKVLHSLKAEGLYPVSIKELSFINRDLNIDIGNSVKARDLSVFSRQFVSILNAGVPIVSALEMLVEQTENKRLKKAIMDTQIMVERGERLADAMRNQGKIFPPILINMVEAGEASGSLEISLDRMSTHFEKEAKLKALVKKAMIYPVMLGIVALGVIILMLGFVIPSFVKMFEDMNMKLPAVTRMIIKISNFMINWWYLIIAVVAVVVLGMVAILKTDKGEHFFAKLALHMPLFGKLKVKSASARFTRTMSTLLAAGISLMDAIDITARTMDNTIIKETLMSSKEEIARGVPLSVPLQASGIFPPMVYHMIKIGENTGSLENMLTKVADYYDEEVEVATQSLTAVMEPIIIIVLAVVVGGLALAILQPVFSMYDQLDSTMLQ